MKSEDIFAFATMHLVASGWKRIAFTFAPRHSITVPWHCKTSRLFDAPPNQCASLERKDSSTERVKKKDQLMMLLEKRLEKKGGAEVVVKYEVDKAALTAAGPRRTPNQYWRKAAV